MDFAHDNNFSAKKAGGIGLTVALHVLAACGLIYGLHRTFTPPAAPPTAKFEPPKTPETKQEPLDHLFKPNVVPPLTFQTMDPPPFVIKNPDAPTTQPPVQPGLTDRKPGTNTDGPPSDGGNHIGIPTSNPLISNLDACKPEYPRSSIINEESGVVRVQFQIGADSRLVAASVLKSSGHRALDNATVSALSRCEFKAAEKNGVPVPSSLVTDYVWKLEAE